MLLLRERAPSRTVIDTGHVALLALFDLDNTLLDREKAFALWADNFIDARGLGKSALPSIHRADNDGFNPRAQFFSELRSELGITDSVDELLADYYVEYPFSYSVEPEVIDVVRSLRAAGFKVGVLTNGPPSQWAKFEAAGIEDEFDAVCISSVVGTRKPDVAIFQAAATICDLPLAGWMVGDSPEADVGGGITAGLRTIWMSRGREWGGFDYSPDFTVASIPEAAELILHAGQPSHLSGRQRPQGVR
jgi:putative hydrolase of the HAD superfamily